MFSRPTSLERKLDLRKKRDANAYNMSKWRTCRKKLLWNELTCRDAASARICSIIDCWSRSFAKLNLGEDAIRVRLKDHRPPNLIKSLCSNFRADWMRRRRCGACERAFGFLIDFIADSPCYGRGGEWSKYERVERGGGQQNYLVSRHPY